MWSTNMLKERFFAYFEKRGHKILPSSPVVPKNDPTLLFTNSGMVQFKNYFLGEPSPYKRVVTSQRCIRAGGKHNDLDDVGKDNYHHTFFEMLGNWSFGDYFKEEAIEFAYDFLINDLKLNKDNMYVTIYEEMDLESKRVWSKFVDPSRIISASFKDNFWEMGELGPCGPCTEIHYDRIGNRDASHLVNKDDPDVVEFWNIVFMEYERTPKGLVPLKVKHIDTGIGLERLLSILMGVRSNYLIDSFTEIIRFIESKCEYTYQDGDSLEDVAFRVLADHSRTIAVCLNDGVQFSSDGVGYVLRRILRRAVRHAHDTLKLEKGVISQCVGRAAEFMSLNADVSLVDDEENLFLKTLVKGLNQLTKICSAKGRLDGSDVFILYDTYGFPADLTEIIARERQIPLSMEGFSECVAKAKEMSGKANKRLITVNFDCPKTDDSFKYLKNGIEASLLAVVVENEKVSEVPVGQPAALVFDRTCFYGESGGQVGDTGTITFLGSNNEEIGVFTVEDTQVQRGYVLHLGRLSGKASMKAKLTYDEALRASTRANHSSVHIFNYFLRTFIKTEQQGSLVDPEKGRFDFESKKLSDEVLDSLEEKMNRFISSNASVDVTAHPKEEVLERNDVIRMAGEDYPESIRVITMSDGSTVIREVCGGTHVSNTSEIKLVRLLSESGIKANTRRVILVSGPKAVEVDKNASELRKRQKSGEVVKIDCPLSISQRREIERVNKENLRKQQKALDESVSSLKKEIGDALLNFKVSSMGETKIFSYDCSALAEYSKKEVSKALVGLLETVSSPCVLFATKDAEVFFVASAPEPESLIPKIESEFLTGSVRLIKNQVQGSIPKEGFSSEKLIQIF